MRHFEKKGSLRLFRRIGFTGSTFRAAVGHASEGETRVSFACGSAAAARRMAGTWARWARDAGYAEIPIPDGIPGVVRTLEGPNGPGRVRIDPCDDVYFDTGAAEGPPLKIGLRVVAHGIRLSPRLKVPYLFGSRLQARRVTRFPEPDWSRVGPRPDLDGKTRDSLAALAGPAIGGHQDRDRTLGDPRPGTLIFAYERGIHRLLRFGRLPGDRVRVVFHEGVLTSNFKRQSTPVLSCVPGFCAPLPAALRGEIARRFGL